MTRNELDRILKKDGWVIEHGAKHDKAKKENIAVKLTLPRHAKDIPIGTVNQILKDAGLK